MDRKAMKNVSLVWPLLIASMFFAIAGCSNVVHVENRTLTATESRRQIELLNEIRPEEIEGKKVSDFPELISLADEIHWIHGRIVRYVFHRKGEGGNDDGSDTSAIIEVDNGMVRFFGLLCFSS